MARYVVERTFPDGLEIPAYLTLPKGVGGKALPTAVIIDRKGKIRYIESGTSTTRLEDMRQMIIKLLAEK